MRRTGWMATCMLLAALAAPAASAGVVAAPTAATATAAMAGAAGLDFGRGIDHVGCLVRLESFDDAADVLSRLGFSTTPVLASPVGAENRLVWLSDLSYLEVDAFTQLNPFTAPFLDFLAQHEGAKFYGTAVPDAAQASAFLAAAGYPNVGPIPALPLTIASTGQVVGLTPLWSSVILTSRLAPDNSNFFLAYDEAQVQQMFADFPALAPRPHANTAQTIDTLWLVVADVDAALGFYEGLGLQVVARDQKIDYLGCRGALVRYHNATLALLAPDGPGLVADFAADRGEGILGVSLDVADLATAHAVAQAGTGLALPVFKHRGRNRFLVPASVLHGVLLEMVQ